jgi:type IV secretory pathway TraG/TraD family ATPase VirD4
MKTEQPVSFNFNSVVTQLKSVDISIYGALLTLVLFAFASIFANNSKGNKIGRARLATKEEVRKSRDAAIAAIDEPREVSLWVGMPDRLTVDSQGKKTLIPNKHTVLLRKANEHIMCYGGAGAGKTRYFLNRLAFSAVMQGLPIIAVDLKGDEEDYSSNSIAPTSEIAGFALENGYEIFSVAPFFKDSHCLNVVELLESSSDVATASQIGGAIVENGLASGDHADTWTQSGGQLIASSLLIARSLEKGGDLVTVQKILARLAADPHAIRSAKLGQYQKAALDEFLAAADSPETAASVAFSALRMMSRMMVPEITGAFCRKSNVPIVLKRKQMVIFRVQPKYASVILPLVSACVEIMLQRNIFSGNDISGLALLDELPQYRIPTLHKIAAVARSKKWIFTYGAQGEQILESEYGKARCKAILENCKTIALMALNSNSTAQDYSKALGEEDVSTKSRSSGQSGSSTSTQDKGRALVPVQRLQQQPTGHALLLTPTVEAKIEGEDAIRVPYWHQFVIPPQELRAIDRAKANWLKWRPIAIANSRAKPLSEDELYGRELLVNSILPNSPKKDKNVQTNPNIKAQLHDLFNAKSL